MISEDLIDMLIDPNPEVRKRGVMQLGKSKDAEALPYLAEVFRDDEDEEVRELARKAGLFIRKNAPAQSSSGSGSRSSTKPAPKARQPEPETTSYSDGSEGLYADDPEEDDVYADADESPLPSELRVSAVDKERAKGLVQQAMDMNMRSDNQRALKALEKALHTDPHLMYDSFTISLASTLTGMDGREAVKSIGPNADQLNKRRSGGSAKRSGIQIIFAYSIIMSAVFVLFGYFLLPWFNIGQVEAEGLDGDPATLNEVWQSVREVYETALDEVNTDEVDDVQSAFNAIDFEVSGINTTLFAIGSMNLADMTGLSPLIELTQFTQGLFTQGDIEVIESQHATEAPDYLLLLIPVSAVIAALLGIFLILRPSVTLWIVTILIGLAGIAGSAYFFTAGEENIRTGIDWLAFMDIPVPDTSLIGIGFWVTLVGMMLIIFIPFLAMLTMPTQQEF